jgi:Tol biopolymer transport system component
VFVASADGSEPRRIWTAANTAFSPAVSPDGRPLRLSVSEGGGLDIARSSLWELDVDGRLARPFLPRFGYSACCGRWTPDGRYFVFEAGDRRSDLWILRETTGRWVPAGSEPARLTQGPMQFLAPVAAPDGRKLYAVGWKPQGELVRYDRDGPLAPYLGGASVQELDFSRDGGWIAYVTYPEGDVWRSRVDGTDRLQLTFPPLEGRLPRWSPDGTQIVFMALAPGRGTHIRIVAAQGGPSRDLLPGDESHGEASWSADGRSLALGSSRPDRPEHPRTIERLDLDTGRLSTIAGSEGLFSPRWSPDGRMLAALSVDQDRLLVLDLASGRWRTALASKWIGWPTWSQDGRYVFLDGEKAQLRVRVADGRCDTLVSTTGLRRVHYSTAGEWTGFAPDGALLALRDVSVNEIFALSWTVP